MKARCPREGLLAACQLASVAVPTREVRPILSKLKFVAEPGRCAFMATDLELGIRHELRGPEVTEAGEVLLPANRLLAILREGTDEFLELEADAERCIIRGTFNEFEMPGEDPADFPDIPTFADEKYYHLSAGVLRTMIRRVAFAAAKQDTKFTMTGVLWEMDGKQARLVATDSKRLALAQGEAGGEGGADPKGQSHLVPSKAMGLLERTLQGLDDDATVRVSLRPNEVLFQTPDTTIYSRLVEGRFPPYRDILPKKSAARATLAVEPFLTAVRQAAVMTDDESKRVAFHFEPGKLTLEAQGQASGRSHVEMQVQFEGQPVQIKFEPQHLIEMLRVLESDSELSLELVDGNRPALFKQGADYSYLVMPMA